MTTLDEATEVGVTSKAKADCKKILDVVEPGAQKMAAVVAPSSKGFFIMRPPVMRKKKIIIKLRKGRWEEL